MSPICAIGKEGAFLSRFTKPLCKFQILIEYRTSLISSGWTAAEVGFLVVKPFKKHTFLANGTNGGQTGNAPGTRNIGERK